MRLRSYSARMLATSAPVIPNALASPDTEAPLRQFMDSVLTDDRRSSGGGRRLLRKSTTQTPSDRKKRHERLHAPVHHRPGHPERPRMRGMPQDREPLGPPTPLSRRRSCRLLRRLSKSPCYCHFHATEHPVIDGYNPPEGWGWCFIDEVMVVLPDQTARIGPIPRYI